jgi:DUF1016 N-terminal domain
VRDSYFALLGEIKERIRSAQSAALRAVNLELLSLYWDIGRLIGQRQKGETWGGPWSRTWPGTFAQNSRELAVSPPRTSGESGSSMKPTRTTKNSHQWCEKLTRLRI